LGQALNSNEPVTDSICYHAQQAAEKYLKLFLVSTGKEPAKSHNIAFLKNACESINPAFLKLTNIEYLTDYAVDTQTSERSGTNKMVLFPSE